jgi:D-xylose 1-dehydrogenase (NADP+, D-xylono-1,5-lactone-forming)
MPKHKVGLVACSSILERRFLPALQESSTAEPFIVGSRDKSKAQKFAQEKNIPNFGTYDDVFTHPDVDWVYISTPPTQHEAQIIKAAENGKHILCEKPAVMSLESAKKVLAVCKANNVKFYEAYVYKFHPQHSVIREYVKDLGRPFLMRTQYSSPRPKDGNIRFDPTLGGGVFFDSVGYAVNSMLYFFKDLPASVSATMIKDQHYDVDQAISLTLNYNNGPVVQTFSGYGVQYRSHYEICCENGRIGPKRAYAMNLDTVPEIEIDTNDGIRVETLDPAHQFLLMVEAFSEFVDSGLETDSISSEEFLKQHRIMDAAYKSLNSNGVVLNL